MKLFLLSFVGMWIGAVTASENRLPKIYAMDLEYRLNESGTGGYNRLLDMIHQQGVRFHLSILPLKRWQNRTKADSQGCFFPTTIGALNKYNAARPGSSLIASHPVDKVNLRVFSAPNKPLIDDVEQLKGLRVAAWKSEGAAPYLSELKISVDESHDETSQLQLLYADRIDAVIGFTPDIHIAADTLELPKPRYADKLTLLRDEGATMVCYDTPENRRFVAEFNDKLGRLKQTGQLSVLLGQYASVAL